MTFARIAAALLVAGALSIGPAAAQSYPSKPVTIVVPFPPGGSVDGVARVLAADLGERTGKTFIIENRAGGAGGVVGSQTVARAAPDGYTLLLNASIHVVTPLINKNTPYDVVNDFSHVALVAIGPLLVTTHPSVKANTLKEFFDDLKKDPDRYNLATTGYGSAGHLAIEFLKGQAGVKADVVAYKGGGPALNDLIGGQIHLLADPMLSSLPHVKAGRLKPLAVTTKQRTKLAPQVPTVAESGMGEFEMVSWYAVWGPKGLDAEAAGYLEKQIGEVVRSEKYNQRLTNFGFEPEFKPAAGLKAFVVEEMTKYGAIVKDAGIKVE